MGIKVLRRKVKHGVSLYLDVSHEGKRWKERLGLIIVRGDPEGNREKERIARIKRSERELELASNMHGHIRQSNRNRDFIGYFEALAITKDVKGHNWHSTAVHLRTFAGDTLPFKLVDEEWLEEFKRFLLESFKRNSAHTYFSKIKAALRHAVKDRIIAVNPAEYVDQISREEVPRTYLLIEEIQKLADTPCLNPELKRAFLFGCASGLRISDIRALRWKNVTDGRIEFQQKKTGKFEYLPLSAVAKEILGPQGNREEPVFQVPFDHQIARDLRRWCQAAGIEKAVTFHTSRHTYATVMLTRGADLPAIQNLLGHRSIRTTQIYAQIIDSKKRDTVDLFPSIKL